MNGYQDRDDSPVKQIVKRAAVLGAGRMGSQIAALFANHGIPCDLFDLRVGGANPNRLAEEAKQRLLTLRPAPLVKPEALDLIEPGNYSDALPRLHEAEWVIEAIAEKPYLKRQLWGEVAPFIRRHALVSTNTSAIQIEYIAQALPGHLRPRFLGAHFFNPPRYLKLMEIIPSTLTEPDALSDVRRFVTRILGKEVVIARDVPGFITNRLGCYSLLVTMQAMDEFGLEPDEVDLITGPAMGRPRSATFRTIDLIGLDIFVDICDHIRGVVTDSVEQDAFRVPKYMREMIRRGWKGEKSSLGFYQRVDDAEGNPQMHAIQLDLMGYFPRRESPLPELAALGEIRDAGERIDALINGDLPASSFAWRILSRFLAYASWKVGEVSDDFASMDQAMRWGFGWSLGPFEIWDRLGVDDTAARMVEDGIELPEWVHRIADDNSTFYANRSKNPA
jgi:3-hydroxyacyl-CoA dehydrogenase